MKLSTDNVQSKNEKHVIYLTDGSTIEVEADDEFVYTPAILAVRDKSGFQYSIPMIHVNVIISQKRGE